jgi:hypothetical protein
MEMRVKRITAARLTPIAGVGLAIVAAGSLLLFSLFAQDAGHGLYTAARGTAAIDAPQGALAPITLPAFQGGTSGSTSEPGSDLQPAGGLAGGLIGVGTGLIDVGSPTTGTTDGPNFEFPGTGAIPQPGDFGPGTSNEGRTVSGSVDGPEARIAKRADGSGWDWGHGKGHYKTDKKTGKAKGSSKPSKSKDKGHGPPTHARVHDKDDDHPGKGHANGKAKGKGHGKHAKKGKKH